METSFLSGKAIGKAISRLISTYDEFHWSVAWGSHAPLAKHLIENARKFRAVTFGIAFSQTDPDLVDALVGPTTVSLQQSSPMELFIRKYFVFVQATKSLRLSEAQTLLVAA